MLKFLILPGWLQPSMAKRCGVDSQGFKMAAQQGWPLHKYEQLPSSAEEPFQESRSDSDFQKGETQRGCTKPDANSSMGRRGRYIILAIGFVTLLAILGWLILSRGAFNSANKSCDETHLGFVCRPEISHFWGQYSPFFAVASEISASIPQQCSITFAQVLARHGARDPTASKTAVYKRTISKVQSQTTSYDPAYAFIKDYQYVLGADQLTTFGQQQMINLGSQYYQRYQRLAKTSTPFVRASDQERVVQSAQNWTQGFHNAKDTDGGSDSAYPYPILKVSEKPGSNNTLDNQLCTAFEEGPLSEVGYDAQNTWLDIFGPPITQRLNQNLQGANLSIIETIYMMDLCPFNTVANDIGAISPFCDLFTKSEWQSYDYYQSLGKFYGYGNGNPLGATQGVGFVNELIARLTSAAVNDHTSTNSTLDSSPLTFPLDANMYADFSHDNDMASIFSALGLYNGTQLLSTSTLQNTDETKGFSASWTTPFAARMYVEKMVCDDAEEELIRILVNDRVIPLSNCGIDSLGRCTVGAFVNSLSFARSGGHWDQCFQ